MTDELQIGEYHPCADDAFAYVKLYITLNPMFAESVASCAIGDNRTAQICHGTIDRIITGKPVSDRYVLGLAWFIKSIEEMEKGDENMPGLRR